MKRILLFAVLATLFLLAGCGYGSGNGSTGGNGGGITPQGNFSVSSLSGQYTYQMNGTELTNNSFLAFSESGIFTADGKGNISNGTDDIVPNTPTSSFTATYSVANDGTGFIQINNGREFAITMVSSSKFYLTEIDGAANISGVGEQQTASALNAVPDGKFVFRIHNEGTLNGSLAQVGLLTLSGGVGSGNEDVLDSNGTASSPTLTASFNAPVSGGRGTGTLTDSNGTLSFQYYIVNASTINIMPTALNATSILGTGRAELQSGAPFAAGSLNGGYAFGSRGDTQSVGGSETVGRFTAGGDGTISAGAEDFVLDGVSGTNDSFTGSYTMASNGRAQVSLTSQSFGSVSETLWMVSPARAFFLDASTTKVEDGSIDLQSTSTFSNANVTGQSAFFMTGNNSSDLIDRIGTLIWDGKGGVTVNEIINATGLVNNVVIPGGTVQVTSNGRAVANVSGLSANLVFYLTSTGSGYMLQNDSATQIGGVAALQSQ
jgi:hypothetical protein